MKNIIWLFVIVVFGLAGCASAPIASETGLTFIHLNDTYRVGAVEDGTAGGLSRVVTLVRELQADGRDVRLLHGGDFLYPSLESQLWNGLQMVDAMNFLNAVAPLYVTAGNHEFDRRGPEQLIAALRESMFTWLGDNYALDTGEPAADQKLQKGFTFTAGDRRVGVFSLTLHGADGGNTRSYVDIDNDYMGVAERAIQALEAQGVDLIIGVTHVHMWQDVEIALLKKRYPKLAFIVGGHEHEPQYFYIEGESAPAMKGASNARVIWQIDVDFDDTGGYTVTEQRTKLDESIPFDPEYEVLADKWNNRLLEKFPFLEARVGAAALAMDAREEHVRSKESSWGNFVVDQMRTAFGDPVADLAFINSGTLRIDDYIAGDILFEDIARTFGFSSYLRYTTVSGAEFREVMENGYRGSGSQGYFPQVSGFRVCVDRSRPDGDRIISMQLPGEDGWAEIEGDKVYTLVVPDFLYGGGDGYELPKHRPASRPGSELKYLVLDAIIAAQAEGRAVGVNPDPDNPRYVELGEGRDSCWPDL